MVNIIWVSNNLKVRAEICSRIMPIFAPEILSKMLLFGGVANDNLGNGF